MKRAISAIVPVLAVAASAAFAACGGPQSAGPAAPEGSASASGGSLGATAAPSQWASLGHEDRAAYMKAHVMPKMAALFKEANADKYAKLTCKTCHGKGVEDGKFKMPNPDLVALQPADGFKVHRDKSPEMVKFMMEKVVPEMAALVGEQPYDPKTKSGFGCMECHTMAK